MEFELSLSPSSTGNVAALVLSRLAAHPLAACGTAPAFVDAATGESLSFLALRRAALSLASGLRLGLGLRRGDAVLVVSRSNSLLIPQILLGVLAAGGVVVAADPDGTPAEIAAAAHGSGAVMIVAAPEEAGKVAGVGVPLLLTSRPQLDAHRALLSAEELIDGGDPTALQPATDSEPTTMAPSSMADELAFLAYYYSSSEKASSRRTAAAATMTHADLVAAVARACCLPPDEEEGRRVCLVSLPMCSAHGLPLIALGLPAAGVTTVLVPPPSESESDPRVTRDAVAAHGATDVVATPEAAAALLAAAGGPMATALACNKLATLRRVIVAPTPFSPETRDEFRRRLPWVRLTEMEEPALEQAQELGRALMLKQAAAAAVIQHNSQTTEQMLATTNEATSPVRPLKKVQNNILGNILSRSTMSKILRKQPVTGNRQAVSKL